MSRKLLCPYHSKISKESVLTSLDDDCVFCEDIDNECSESSGDAVLEDSTSPKKAEPEAEKDLSESREQEHEQKGD